MRSRQSGFSLIELMVVVAIIGILAAVAVPSYQTYTKKAKYTEIVSAASAVKLAVSACTASAITWNTACADNNGGVPRNDSTESTTAVISTSVLTWSDADSASLVITGGTPVDSKDYELDFENGVWSFDAAGSNCDEAGFCNGGS